MVRLRSPINLKDRRAAKGKYPEEKNFWFRPYPELTIKDMPEFKNRLYLALETDQVFMQYNGRKYSREFAKFAVRVTENKRK